MKIFTQANYEDFVLRYSEVFVEDSFINWRSIRGTNIGVGYGFGGFQWFDREEQISFEQVLERVPPDVQEILLFNLDLFR